MNNTCLVEISDDGMGMAGATFIEECFDDFIAQKKVEALDITGFRFGSGHLQTYVLRPMDKPFMRAVPEHVAQQLALHWRGKKE
jgi:hypothetical protein